MSAVVRKASHRRPGFGAYEHRPDEMLEFALAGAIGPRGVTSDKGDGILCRVPLAHNVLAYALTERGAELRETTDAGAVGRGRTRSDRCSRR